MAFYQNFVRFCNAVGKSPSRVAEDCGIARATVNRWKNGGCPSDATLYRIADYFGVSADEILMDSNADPIKTELDSRYSALDEHGKYLVDLVLSAEYARCNAPTEGEMVVALPRRMIRRYLGRPAAGVGGMIEGEDYEDIELPDDAPAGADYCLTVSGDSMEPLIHDGQMVFVKRDVALEPMDVAVFIVDGEAYIKHFFPGISNQIYLVSANPERQDANIVLLDDGQHSVYCAGKVLL